MKSISTKQLTHDKWLQLRRGGIGGSDAAAVMGLSPYKTALDVYLDKTGAKEPQRDNARMKAGRLLEDVAARWWALENGFKVRRDHKIRFHPKHNCLLANIDRLITGGGERGTGVLEVKTTSGWVYKKWEDDGLPKDTYCQIMHYLNITGHRWGRVAVLVDGYHLHDIPVEYDKEFIHLMNAQLLAFWHEHVLRGIPPEPVNEQDLKSLWPRAQEKIVQADANALRTVDRLVDVTGELARLSDEKKELELQIKLLLRDACVLADGDSPLVTWRHSKDSQRFDPARFREDHPDLYGKYLETFPGSRRFVVKHNSHEQAE